MKNIFKILFLSYLTINLYANTNKTNTQHQLTNANAYYLHIRNKLNKGMNVNSGNSGIIENRKVKIDTYLDTTIYSDIENYSLDNKVQEAKYANYLADNKKYQEQISLIKYRQQNTNKNNTNENNILNVSGYCYVTNDIKVYFSDAFNQMNCDLQNIKTKEIYHINVFVKLMPDYKREILIAFPIYATLNNEKYNAVGFFLNAEKTSLNVADEVDGVRIKKLLLKGLLVESDIAYNQAMQYLNDLRASKTSSSVSYVTNGNDQTIPVQSQTTQKPDAKDYINVGVVQSIAALIKMLGENSLYELKPLFYIHKDSVLYTEMILKRGSVFEKMQKQIQQQENNIIKNNKDYQESLKVYTTTKPIK